MHASVHQVNVRHAAAAAAAAAVDVEMDAATKAVAGTAGRS